MSRAIYPLYAPSDEGKVRPILEALKAKGVSVRTDPGKKDALVLFLSRDLKADGPVADRFVRLNAGRELVIPVNLDGCPVPEELQSALMARHSLDGRKYGTAELADLIARAALGEKRSKLPLILSLLGVAALLLVGVLIYLRQRPEPEPPVVEVTATPTPEPTATPSPTPTPEPRIDGIDLPLSEVAEVVYIGGTLHYYQMSQEYRTISWDGHAYHEFAYENWEGGRSVFYSTEDGQEIPMGDLGDVSYLKLLPNLMYLTFVNVQGELPDLSALQKLRGVTIMGCDIPDIRGLAGSSVNWLEYHGDAVTDFTPLNDCPQLNGANLALWGQASADLNDFHPKKLNWLNLGSPTDKLEGLSKCDRLQRLFLDGVTVTDLSFLKGLSLNELRLEHLDRLTDLTGLEGMWTLLQLDVHGCHRLRDISALTGCNSLKDVNISGDYGFMEGLTDVSVLGTLQHLQNIGLYGVNARSVDFLKELRLKKNINLGIHIADDADFSGLEAVETFSRLSVNAHANFAAIAPHIQGKSVRQLEIFDGGNVDLSTLPNVTSELILDQCNNRDLTGMPLMPLMTGRLSIANCPYFTSFDGIENLPEIGKMGSSLVVENCPRLADWSGIEGKAFFRVELRGVFTLPDLASLAFRELALEYLDEDVLPDLRCLDGLDENKRYSFRFVGMDQITDLSPLFRLRGEFLEVPPQVGEQAQGLVEDKHFNRYEIVYPDGSWDPNDVEVRLLSLEELDTLPPSILKHVKHVTIIGDELVNDDTMNFWSDWSERDVPAFIEDRETGEQKRIDKPGTMFTDFSRLSMLTGLEDLNLWWQPLTNLEGIQALENLRWLKVMFSPQLTDVSAAFTLQGLREINFERCPVASLQGVQNLYDLEMLEICNTKITSLEGIEGLTHLRQVRVAGTSITDFSPLAAVDFSYAMEQEWMPGASLALNVMNSRQLPEDAFAFLENLPGFGSLELHDVPARLWVDKLAGRPVLELGADNCGITDEQLKALVEAHPELQFVSLAWNQQLTDVSALLGLENLREVVLSDDMPQAIRSLGEGYGFELRIN